MNVLVTFEIVEMNGVVEGRDAFKIISLSTKTHMIGGFQNEVGEVILDSPIIVSGRKVLTNLTIEEVQDDETNND